MGMSHHNVITGDGMDRKKYTVSVFLSVNIISILRVFCQTLKTGSEVTLIKSFAGWWLSPTPLKNDGIRQLG